MNYESFLSEKQVYFKSAGFEPDNINNMLYDFQAEITKWAIRKGKAAVFADCGLGKTPIQLEWARQVFLKTQARLEFLNLRYRASHPVFGKPL